MSDISSVADCYNVIIHMLKELHKLVCFWMINTSCYTFKLIPILLDSFIKHFIALKLLLRVNLLLVI